MVYLLSGFLAGAFLEQFFVSPWSTVVAAIHAFTSCAGMEPRADSLSSQFPCTFCRPSVAFCRAYSFEGLALENSNASKSIELGNEHVLFQWYCFKLPYHLK